MTWRLNVVVAGLGLCAALAGCSAEGINQVAFDAEGRPNADLQQAASGFAEHLTRHDERSLRAYTPSGESTGWAATWSRSCQDCRVTVAKYYPDADSGSIASVEYSATCGSAAIQFRVTWIADSDRWAAADTQQPPRCP